MDDYEPNFAEYADEPDYDEPEPDYDDEDADAEPEPAEDSYLDSYWEDQYDLGE